MLIAQPGPQDIERPAAFLESPQRPEGTLSYLGMRGFLFAIATGPVLVQPSEWMPALFGNGEPEYEDFDEANAIIGTIMACYNVAAQAGRRTQAIPPDLVGIDEESDESRSAWSFGFTLGFDYLRDDWDEVLDELDTSDLQAFEGALLNLTVWLDPPTRQARLGISDEKFEELLSACRSALPGDLATFAQLGREAYERGLSDRAVPASSSKVGRNDPCPCGSGKKYKKCCLVN